MENEITKEGLQEMLEPIKSDILQSIDEKIKPLDEKIANITVNASQEEEDKFLKGGFDNIGDFAKSVHQSGTRLDDKMKSWMGVAEKTLNEGVQSDGGFTLPPEFSTNLWQRSIEESQFYDKCFKIPTKGNEYHMPALVDETHASSLFGGVTMYYKAEEAQYTASYPKFREVEWKLNKLTGLAYISDELLEDSAQNMSAVMNQLFVSAMKWQMDKDILTGSGVGKPLGILDAPSLISVGKDTGQVAATLTYTNLVNMWVRQWRAGNADWVTSSDAMAQLMTMTIEGGTASTPIWIPGNDASKAPNGTIFGRPIIQTEHCAALGTTGDIYNIDFSQYAVAHKNNGGIKSATSMHLKFDYDQLAYKISFRWDGQSMWNTAFQPANSHSTKSPFIKLDARA